MGKKWDLEKIESFYEVIETDEFMKIIAEVAEMVSFEFCQLQNDSSVCVLDNEFNSLEKAA